MWQFEKLSADVSTKNGLLILETNMAPSIKFEEPSTIQALGGRQETGMRFSPTALSVTTK